LFLDAANVYPDSSYDYRELHGYSISQIRKIDEMSINLEIIAIYLAHYSIYNEITDNIFKYIKGDCIRLRDFSNENIIKNNEFIKCSIKGICAMWYCDSKFHECTKRRAECPSYENIIKLNIAYGDWYCEVPKIFFNRHREPKDRCRINYPQYQKYVRLENNEINSCEE
jgi:hypothetical protein